MTNTTSLTFINHASILVSHGEIALLSDPWYQGDAFHKGWSLIHELTQLLINRYVSGCTKLKSFLYSIFIFIFVSTVSIAQVDSIRSNLEIEIIDIYDSLLADKVTCNLLANYENYLESPNKYWDFLNETFVYNWDFDATTKALIGNEIFNSLSNLQFKELSRVLEVTLIRYAFESLFFYGEQKLNVIDIKINEKQTLAWLKINMDSPRFPDIHLDLLLKRTDDDKWKGVDFRFKGITYVNLKKNSYRQDFKDSKFVGLLKKLDNKNKLFFEDLCESEANYIDPKKQPCLQNYDKK